MNVNAGVLIELVSFYLLLFLLFAVPALLVVFSRRVKGSEKTLWALAAGVTSWLGFVVFMFATRPASTTRAG